MQMMNRVGRSSSRTRVPLGARSANAENGALAGGNNNNNGKSSKGNNAGTAATGGGGGLTKKTKSTILPSKKGLPSLERKLSGTSAASQASSVTGSETVSSSANDRAFGSMGSDTLRRALQSGASSMMVSHQQAAGSGGGNDNNDAGSDIEGGDMAAANAANTARRQPLGTSRRQNEQRRPLERSASSSKGVEKQQQQQQQQQQPLARSKSVSAAEKPSAAPNISNEPITIIEHRKRPCGEGYTVHKYLRGKLLGKGGFAKVYKVTSLDTNKEYAIKIVPKANLVKSRARHKLQTEIKIHRTMKHANICEYKHFFEDKTNCYILLELCHNHSLNEMIKRRKSLTEEEARLLMLQLVEAVHFMHDSNVIHRDLKLGNLFLSRSMNIKVGDFGLACRVDSTDEKRKTICGTPNYIAPEVIEGNKEKRGHSFEVDVWSMGVICYTMLVGRPPYESKDVKSTYRRILANEYSFPEGRVENDARSLIASMLQTDPKARPSLEEIRYHPFFTMHQIPGSLPSTCTVSAPIWATDEFGELYAVKPTSALDVHVRSSTVSKKLPTTATATAASCGSSAAKRAGGSGVLRNNVPGGIGGNSTNKPSAKQAAASAAVSAAAAFNIYDDVNDEVECKLEPQSGNAVTSGVEAEQQAAPVNRLMEKMTSCGFDDDAPREMPPPASSTSSPEMGMPLSIERGKSNQSTPTTEVTTGSGAKAPSSSSSPSSPSGANDDMNELVLMNSRLEECLANYERIQNGGAKVECPLKGGEVWGANKWVTRYVDYTSKYGLGFLLNDGSSGVYFNDSTKGMQAAEGEDFVYVERRKTSADGVREPVSAYTLSNYPEDELKKKVTLLQHFRSYLLDQQKRAEEAGEAEPLTSNFEERQDAATSSPSGERGGDGVDPPMVFMKKWIKTKHAMLFRLSNGTVQVLFYDLTEVLISSEGNLITYVDKEKNRFVHSIAEIANKQHGDVSRRLKYAKEILSQLISASRR